MRKCKKTQHKICLNFTFFVILSFFLLIIIVSTASAWVLNDVYGVNRQQVKIIQKCLNLMGHNSGPADGLWGPRTDAAIRGWLAKHNLINTDVNTAYQQFLKACQTTQQAQTQAQNSASTPQSSKIKYGMTKGEMRTLIGNPHAVKGEEPNVYWWYYISENEIYLLQFQHGIYVDTIKTNLDELNKLEEKKKQGFLWNAENSGIWR